MILLAISWGECYATDKPDQKLVDASISLAKKLNFNPIPIFKTPEGVFITGGAQIAIRNGAYALIDNDMIINVGTIPIKFSDIKHLLSDTSSTVDLSTGEYAVFKEGKIIKQKEKIAP